MANNKIEHHSNECVHTHTKQLHYQTFRTSRSNSEGLSLVRWNFFEAPFVALFMIDCMATQTMRRMQSKYHSATMNDERWTSRQNERGHKLRSKRKRGNKSMPTFQTYLIRFHCGCSLLPIFVVVVWVRFHFLSLFLSLSQDA